MRREGVPVRLTCLPCPAGRCIQTAWYLMATVSSSPLALISIQSSPLIGRIVTDTCQTLMASKYTHPPRFPPNSADDAPLPLSHHNALPAPQGFWSDNC